MGDDRPELRNHCFRVVHSGVGGGVSRRIHGSVHDLAVVSLCCSVVCPRQAKHESEASGSEGIPFPSLMDRLASVALCETVIVYRECGKDATALRGLQKRVAEGEVFWGVMSDPLDTCGASVC